MLVQNINETTEIQQTQKTCATFLAADSELMYRTVFQLKLFLYWIFEHTTTLKNLNRLLLSNNVKYNDITKTSVLANDIRNKF